MRLRASRLAFALAALLATVPLPAAAARAVWLAAGDVHLDPFDRSAGLAPGEDTGPALFASALRAMRAAVPDPQVVLLTGDFLAHRWGRQARGAGRNPEDAAIAAMRSMAAGFGRAFPHAQFVVALGNNDAPCGDYHSAPGSRFARAAAAAWAPLVDRDGSAPGFAKALAGDGYYTVRLPAAHLQLIAIDTVPFSQAYRGPCRGGDSRPNAQLAWLKTTLRAAPPGTRSVVLMHVPPGYDAFSTELTRGFFALPYLNARDNAALVRLLEDPASRVAFAVAGHAHRFDVRLFGGAPLVVLGSISPIYGNAPVFYRLRVNGDLEDLSAFAFDEDRRRWSGPHDFDRTWRVGRLDAAALAGVHARLGEDLAARAAWQAASVGWSARVPRALRVWRTSSWRIPWCAQTFAGDGFARCAGIERRTDVARAAIVAGGVLALIGLAAVIGAAVRILRANRKRKGSVPGPP